MTKKRPTIAHGSTKRILTGCGKLYVTLNRDEEGNPIEVFIRLGKAGGCAASQTESLGRLISIILKYGTDIKEVIKQLSGIGCHQPVFIGEGKRTLSCADAVSQALVAMLGLEPVKEIKPKKEKVVEKEIVMEDIIPKVNFEKVTKAINDVIGACPDCGAQLSAEEGCLMCHSCGYSKC